MSTTIKSVIVSSFAVTALLVTLSFNEWLEASVEGVRTDYNTVYVLPEFHGFGEETATPETLIDQSINWDEIYK